MDNPQLHLMAKSKAHPVLLWFDNDLTKTLQAKVALGARRYHEKYGLTPNVCFVSPGTVVAAAEIAGVRIVASRNVLPNYLWIGVQSDADKGN